MKNKTILAMSVTLAVAAAGFLGYGLAAHEGHDHGPSAIKYSIVNLEYNGTKVWVPSVLIVPKGAKVELKLINNTPSGVHGFSIPDYKVKVEVAKDKPQEISFVADRAGLFPINCHMHPAHVGGQLLVLDMNHAGGDKEPN